MQLPTEDRIVSPKTVMAKTSLSRTTIWRLARKGDFPPYVKLSPNRIGWSLQAVDAWLSARQTSPADGEAA